MDGSGGAGGGWGPGGGAGPRCRAGWTGRRGGRAGLVLLSPWPLVAAGTAEEINRSLLVKYNRRIF